MLHDTIFIEELCVPASIGVYDWEKRIKQDLYFDLQLRCTLSQAGSSDDLADTISYVDIAECVVEVVHSRHYDLIEALAEEVSHMILNRFAIDSLVLKLSKPGAVPAARNVGVMIERARGA